MKLHLERAWRCDDYLGREGLSGLAKVLPREAGNRKSVYFPWFITANRARMCRFFAYHHGGVLSEPVANVSQSRESIAKERFGKPRESQSRQSSFVRKSGLEKKKNKKRAEEKNSVQTRTIVSRTSNSNNSTQSVLLCIVGAEYHGFPKYSLNAIVENLIQPNTQDGVQVDVSMVFPAVADQRMPFERGWKAKKASGRHCIIFRRERNRFFNFWPFLYAFFGYLILHVVLEDVRF